LTAFKKTAAHIPTTKMSDFYGAADGAAFELQVTNCPSQVNTLATKPNHVFSII
jgi:hypothetical protein